MTGRIRIDPESFRPILLRTSQCGRPETDHFGFGRVQVLDIQIKMNLRPLWSVWPLGWLMILDILNAQLLLAIHDY